MSLSINVQYKISSLLRRNQPFYALSYCWNKKQLVVLENQNQYFQSLVTLRDQGLAKRSQCYLDHFVQFGGIQFAIYLVSYGDIRKWKMMYGQSPISKCFDVCMFDYVYLFVQTKQFAAKKIHIRMRQLIKMEKYHDFDNMKKSAEILFGGINQKETSNITQIQKNPFFFRE